MEFKTVLVTCVAIFALTSCRAVPDETLYADGLSEEQLAYLDTVPDSPRLCADEVVLPNGKSLYDYSIERGFPIPDYELHCLKDGGARAREANLVEYN